MKTTVFTALKRLLLLLVILTATYRVTTLPEQSVAKKKVTQSMLQGNPGVSAEISEIKSLKSEKSAVINFRIYKHGVVKLAVYYPDGSKAQELAEGEMEPGEYSVAFKSVDSQSSFRYICRIETDGSISEREFSF